MEASTGAGGASLPRRQAAKAAREIFQEQLDSDSDSDADADAGKGARKARVARGGSVKRKRAATVGGADRRSVGGGVASGLAASVTASVERTPISRSHSDVLPRPRPRPRPVSAVLPPVAAAKACAPLVIETADLTHGELSDLTPLSSEPSPVFEFRDEAENVKPVSSASASVRKARARSPKRPAQGTPAKNAKRGWQAPALGSYVWVLVDPHTRRVRDGNDDGDEEGSDSLWWPGQIKSALKAGSDAPLKVMLFGDKDTFVSIKSPSATNVLPRDINYLPRFQVPTFVPAAPASKQKGLERQAVGAKWKAAVDAMRRHDLAANLEDDSDDFPEPTGNLFEYLRASPSKPVSMSISAPAKPVASTSTPAKGKRKRPVHSDTGTDEDRKPAAKKKEKKEDEWWDEVDEELKLPGELVLGRTSQSADVDHWPGKLLAYTAPTKPRTFGKYTVQWLDGEESRIPRAQFYTTDQDEFATCKLGEFDSAIVEVQNDVDGDEGPAAYEHAQRSPSPDVLDTAPTGSAFAQLSIRAQFVHTKNVLSAILRDEYAPVRQRQARYMRGGKHRQSLVDDASMRGRMDPREVTELLGYIREWCLRRGPPRGDEGDSPACVEAVPSLARDDMRECSPAPTAGFPSSPQMPPSSYPTSNALQRDASIMSVFSDDQAGTLEPRESPAETPIAMSIASEPATSVVANEAIDEDIIDLDDTSTQPGSSLPRQRGSDAYEALSELEKVDYCLNILLPEAIRQILLWREGKRTSAALLAPVDEEALYKEGTALLEETDWVNDVMRYRRGLEKVLAKGKATTSSKRETARGTRTRKNAGLTSYLE